MQSLQTTVTQTKKLKRENAAGFDTFQVTTQDQDLARNQRQGQGVIPRFGQPTGSRTVFDIPNPTKPFHPFPNPPSIIKIPKPTPPPPRKIGTRTLPKPVGFGLGLRARKKKDDFTGISDLSVANIAAPSFSIATGKGEQAEC